MPHYGADMFAFAYRSPWTHHCGTQSASGTMNSRSSMKGKAFYVKVEVGLDTRWGIAPTQNQFDPLNPSLILRSPKVPCKNGRRSYLQGNGSPLLTLLNKVILVQWVPPKISRKNSSTPPQVSFLKLETFNIQR